jgi:alkylation response protein AidB-like acyl-CoA dehydrogenase
VWLPPLGGRNYPQRVRFDLTEVQAAWQTKARALAADLTDMVSAGGVVLAARNAGLLEPAADLLSEVVATEALAAASPGAGLAYALHVTAAHALHRHVRRDELWRGETVGALTLSADHTPTATGGRLTGVASWVAPATLSGIALVGARSGDRHEAFALALDDPGISATKLEAAGLAGLSFVNLTLVDVPAEGAGETTPIMARARVLIAAVGLGIGRRALREALSAVRAAGGADDGEQTVQGLLADTATELDAATLLTWDAAATDRNMTLGQASIAKLSATEAAQHAVLRATQVIGADTFRGDHTIDRLSQDVRALELFAGRTESLRAAVAAEIL